MSGQSGGGMPTRGRRDLSSIGRVGRGPGGGASSSGGGSGSLASLGLKRGSALAGGDDEAPPAVEWRPGQRVRHVKFDAGEVVRVDGEVIVVRFDGHGEKRLIASFARLEPIT
jgi:DNA helicase-2/ATP-dependent DNA helicase PcrA